MKVFKVLFIISMLVISCFGLLFILQPTDNPVQQAREKYNITDYSCTFIKHEIVNGKLMPVETADVLFLENPFSVYMVFQNPNKIKRLLYIENKFINKSGKECVIVEPNGLLRLFVSSLWIPVDDPRILNNSRNTIKSFGFKKTLDKVLESLKEHYNFKVLDGKIFKHDDGKFVLYLYMDNDLRIPIASYIYEDNLLIGSYEYKNIKLNIGLTEENFYGLGLQ